MIILALTDGFLAVGMIVAAFLRVSLFVILLIAMMMI